MKEGPEGILDGRCPPRKGTGCILDADSGCVLTPDPRPPPAPVTMTMTLAQSPALFPDARGQWWPGCAGRSGLVFGRLRSASWLTGVQSMERAGRRDALRHLFPLSAQFYGEMIDTRGGMVGTWRRCAARFRPAARSARRAPPALLRLAGLEASRPCWRRPREPGILTLPAGAWLPPPPLQSRLRTPPAPSIYVRAPGPWCTRPRLRLPRDFELPTSGHWSPVDSSLD